LNDISINDANILVIDDSSIFLKTIAIFLEKAGCKVHQALDAKEAIKLLREVRVDVILSDFEMPDFSGPKLCQYLKQDKELRSIPIIILTAKGDQRSFMEAVTSGADDFVSKTNFKDILIPKIFCMLRLRNLRKELVDLKELEAVRTLIGTFKHEFNNKLMIMNGNLNKVKKLLDEDNQKPISKIEDGIKFIAETIKKMDHLELQDVHVERYDDQENIYKVK
jgi:CheY-like chemotaxis protein